MKRPGKKKRVMTAAAAAVARRGIKLGSSYAPRSRSGTRFPESARVSAQSTVRAALARPLSPREDT